MATVWGDNQYSEIMCMFDFTMQTELTSLVGCYREQCWAGNEALHLGGLAGRYHERRKPLTLLSWRPESPPFTHPFPHQVLSRESERWFNFHSGSPPALGSQMWQITCVGILVWRSVQWVRVDSSSSFNLSQMDLEPGANGLSFCQFYKIPWK